jgi:hypothetical protein
VNNERFAAVALWGHSAANKGSKSAGCHRSAFQTLPLSYGLAIWNAELSLRIVPLLNQCHSIYENVEKNIHRPSAAPGAAFFCLAHVLGM